MREDSDLKLAEIESSRRSACSSSLPEPPAVRERLVQEIQFFVSYLRQKSEERGQVVYPLLNSPDNRDLLDYVARSSLKEDRDLMSRGSSASGGTCSRPMSAVSSRDGRETPLRLHTPTSEEGRYVVHSNKCARSTLYYMHIHKEAICTVFLCLHHSSQSSYVCSQTSMLSDRVEAINQHVNAFDIDAVVKHLRSVTVCCTLSLHAILDAMLLYSC